MHGFVVVWLKVATSKAVDADDGILVLSLLFSVGLSIAVSFQAVNGIGRHINTLTATQRHSLEKAGYPSNLLLVAVLAVPKSAILLLLC